MGNKHYFLDLGLFHADARKTPYWALDGTRSDELNESVHEAIRQLTT